ncbi:hypothetical protein BDF14DRAFT_1767073 [Spinellus fusiger]|nr:hypothetical protein BDF14DRAFT_1767073 [Spinellus fusiger]
MTTPRSLKQYMVHPPLAVIQQATLLSLKTCPRTYPGTYPRTSSRVTHQTHHKVFRRWLVTPTARRVTGSTHRLAASGIFEPFLDTSAKSEQPSLSYQDILQRTTVQDLLPAKDQHELMLKHQPMGLSIENQKKITTIALACVHSSQTLSQEQTEQILELADRKASELTALGNIILRSSQCGAPVALELYKCAMTQGEDTGAFSYASMIYRGYRGTPKKEEEGVRIMSTLAQKGHPYAQMNLAAILMRTQPEKVSAALQLYTLAGKGGQDSAYAELGRMYRLGYGVHQDHGKAIEHFKQGARTGNPQCNFMLGVYYSSGLGMDNEPDQTKAFKYFQKAAVKGMPEAQYNVGLRFLKGYGVEANHFNAAEFFRMAALQGFQLAQANLAAMYVEGRGVRKDLEEARSLLIKAAASGGSIGKESQRRLEAMEGSPKEKSKCAIM